MMMTMHAMNGMYSDAWGRAAHVRNTKGYCKCILHCSLVGTDSCLSHWFHLLPQPVDVGKFDGWDVVHNVNLKKRDFV